MKDSAFDEEKRRMRGLYNKRARYYDVTANLFYLIGFREWAYRKQAVEALKLKPGDTVIELGCGTGLNFSLLENVIGQDGKIIGVDLTEAMLARAAMRVRKSGWKNIELIASDAGEYEFKGNIGGILATFAITAIPEYDAIIARVARSLSPGKRLVILELKQPDQTPEWVVKLARTVLKPFGVKPEHATYTPWRSIEKHFGQLSMREYYGGVAYIAVGEKAES